MLGRRHSRYPALGRHQAAPRGGHAADSVPRRQRLVPPLSKVFWYMEQKGLRYATQRIYLQGDPREPPKQASFVRDVSPSGAVPVLEIAGEIVPESLRILRRLKQEFPDDEVQRVNAGDAWVQVIMRASDEFDCDGDAWLQNLEEEDEAELREAARAKLAWLEEQLGTHAGGPFFLGAMPSLLDALYVGFLSRLCTNYRFFKQLDVTHETAGLPAHTGRATHVAAAEQRPARLPEPPGAA